MVHWFAAVSQHNSEHSHSIVARNKSWRPQLRDQTLCFSAWDKFFLKTFGDHNCVTKRIASLHETGGFFWSCNEGIGMMQAATKGSAWCKHNAELMERTVAFRKLLLVGSGCLEIPEGMDVLNKHEEQSSFRQCITFCQQAHTLPTHGGPKDESRLFFIASWLLFHGNVGLTSKDATTNGLRDHKPKNRLETSLWQAWVAWIEHIYGEKSFESITDSQLIHLPWQCSSWIVTSKAKIHSYRLSDVFMSWMSLAKMNSRNRLLKQNMSKESPFGSASHFANMGSYKAGSPTSNALLWKAESRQLFSSHMSQLRGQSTSCTQSKSFTQSLYCK